MASNRLEAFYRSEDLLLKLLKNALVKEAFQKASANVQQREAQLEPTPVGTTSAADIASWSLNV